VTPTTQFDANPKICGDCGERLDAKATEHGIEGFGHQQRCCACYDLAMGVPPEIVEERRIRDAKETPTSTTHGRNCES